MYFKVCQGLDTQSLVIDKICFALSIQSELYAYYKTVGDGFSLKKVFFQNTDNA